MGCEKLVTGRNSSFLDVIFSKQFMPYLTKESKDRLNFAFSHKGSPQNAGELNFMFTTIITRYLKEHGLSYQRTNDCIGALEGCKLELYRRLVAQYEDKKIEENGDVY